jgi:uncharacterized protein YkwD
MNLAQRLICVVEKSFGLAVFASIVIGSVLFFESNNPPQHTSATPSTTKPASKQPATAVDAVDIISLTNQNRAVAGIATLTTNSLLTQAAQQKADDMAAKSYYAHISPEGRSPLYWLNLAGYQYLNAGENLVIDRTTSEQVVDSWMSSPDHRENILRPQFTEIGVGVASGAYEGLNTIYVVQEFGTPLPQVSIARATVIEKHKNPPAAVPAPALAIATLPPTTLSEPQVAPPRLVANVKSVVSQLIPKPRVVTVQKDSFTSSVSASSTAEATTSVLNSPYVQPAQLPEPFALPIISPTIISNDIGVSPVSNKIQSANALTQTPIVPVPFVTIVRSLNRGFQSIISNYVPL